MAEIKSTLELVMEKMAAMDDVSDAEFSEEEKIREGMRLGAAYMRGEAVNFVEVIQEKPEQDRSVIQKGAVKALLRNIALPRDEDQKYSADLAMQGLVQIGSGAGDLYGMFGDMKTVFDQYLQHREQLRKQLEDAFAQQMGQMENSLAQQTGMKMKLDASQHPKFQEEWQRILSELNEQYGRALEQQKEQVKARLA